MARINILDKSIYNRISAGEVVENPASIVKELAENSIDAGADSITVSIENGGIKSITVTDNGSGMEKEDLLRSVMPHATSKICTAEDLETIGTLGFRGEALASIAAVSETTIKSRYFEDDCANYIEVKGGEVVQSGVCGLHAGTQVNVKSLFYNTPARYKFLKNAKGEESCVTQLVSELIFANPETAFSYSIDGKTVLQTTGEGLKEAIYAVYGEEVASDMLPFSIEDKGYRINGFTARPSSAAIKNNRSRQVFIVNGRIVEDSTLSAVVQNAYGEHLMKRTFPTVIVDILMPFELVDVNVHPNKREVRFADKKIVSGLVYHAVKKSVEDDAKMTQKTLFQSMFKNSSMLLKKENSVITDEIAADIVSSKVSPTIPENKIYESDAKKIEYVEKSNLEGIKTIEQTAEVYGNDCNFTAASTVFPRADDKERFSFTSSGYTSPQLSFNDSAQTETQNYELKIEREIPSYRILGQLFDTYLLLEIKSELIFIDQHAAHERLLFDQLIADSEKNLAIQDLMFPYVYPLNGKEINFALANKDKFEKLGFTVEINTDGIAFYSVPCLLTNLDIGGFMSELIEYEKSFNNFLSSAVIKDKIAKIACKRAIKGGDKLSDNQIEYVLDYFFSKGVPLQCPHGRPTMIKLTRDEIERRFGRKI